MDGGILLIDKKVGVSSRAVDSFLHRRLGTRKTGHLGTLDPFASGLLVIGVDKGTKLLRYLDDSYKSYIATLRLGVRTDTGDLTGKAIEEREVPSLDLSFVSGVMESFVGKSMQTPPSFSAKKVDGVASYKKARRGEEVILSPKEIEITSIRPLTYIEGELVFTCTVSRGTYVRTLGEDIARKLGTVGHLTALRRLSVGPFLVAEAKKEEEVTREDLLDPTLYIRGIKHVEVDEDTLVRKVKNGVSLVLPDYGERIFITHKGEVYASYIKKDDIYVSERGLW